MAEYDGCQCTRCQVSRSLQRSTFRQNDQTYHLENQGMSHQNQPVTQGNSNTKYGGRTQYGAQAPHSRSQMGEVPEPTVRTQLPPDTTSKNRSKTFQQSLPSTRDSGGWQDFLYRSLSVLVGGSVKKESTYQTKKTTGNQPAQRSPNNQNSIHTKTTEHSKSQHSTKHSSYRQRNDSSSLLYSGSLQRQNRSKSFVLSNHAVPSWSDMPYVDSADYHIRGNYNFLPGDSITYASEISDEIRSLTLGSRSYSAMSGVMSRTHTYSGRHENICSIFWKIGLVCCNFKHGDRPVQFESFWPNTAEMETLLWESYCSASLKKCVLDLCRISICCGPVSLLKSLLMLNILGVNTKLEEGGSLLHLSCIAQNPEATKLLRMKGARKGATDKQGRTALEVCHNRSVLSVLMSPSPSTTLVTPHAVTGTKKQALTLYDKEILFEMATSCTELDDLLLKLQTYEFDVNAEVNENGDFLLHTAIREGLCQLPLIMQLVKTYRADIDLPNRAGLTPLMILSESGDHVLADVLLCVMNANPDTQTSDQGFTALHYSCQNNHVDVTHTLLKRGANFNKQDKDKLLPDDIAVNCGHLECSDLIRIHRKDRFSQLNQLINEDQLKSTDVKDTDLCNTDPDTGFTLLMLAAKLNKLKALRVLLNYDDVPVNAQHEKSMQTALSFAADEGNIEAMKSLLQNGGNPGILDIERLIPIHHAVKNNHVDFVTELLQQPGCLLGLELSLKLCVSEDMKKVIRTAMNRRQREIVTPVLLECSMSGDAERLYCTLEEGDCLNPVSPMGQWPLYLAVENQHMDVIKLLCQNGADLKRRHPSTGNTVLHLACTRGFYEITVYLLQCYMGEWSVLSRDPNQIIHVMNYDSKTALMLAAEQGHSKLVALLLHHGSSTSVLSPQGELYSCQQFEGCQSLIEKNRGHHTKLVFSAVGARDGLKKLQQIFLPKFDHNLRDDRGNTPLMVACYNQNVGVVNFLLKSAVYILDHSKNFCGSFTRTFVSSQHGSDSGKHTSQENVEGCQDVTCSCHNNNQKAGLVDSVMGPESLERCKFCIGNSQENLCSLGNGSQGNQKLNNNNNSLLNTSVEKSTDLLHKTLTTESKLDVLDNMERCPCSKCSNISQTSDTNPEALSRNVSLSTLLRKSSPLEESLPEDEEYEQQIKENMSALFTSISSVNNRGSIFVTEIMVSHLCAISLVDGATSFHRLVEGGDSLAMFESLLETDHTGVNIQDNLGLTPLHLACQLGRKKIVQKLTTLSYVDLNTRTLDGKLPEEMTTDKNIHKLVLRARNQEPVKSVLSPLMTLSTSMFGAGTYNSIEASSVDFEQTNTQFMRIKEQMQQSTQYLDESAMMMTSVHF